MSELQLSRIHKAFGTHPSVIDDLSLNVPSGKLTALLGPSGCGKTTLLRIIAGLEQPEQGTIRLDGQMISDWPAHERRFGMVFQSFALFPHLNVEDNVAYALMIAGIGKAQRRHRARELLDLVDLVPLHRRRVGELSGGQKQRVAIARALAQEPRILLLDEPLSALDARLREAMQIELRLLQQRLGITTVVVTHDQQEAMAMADRVVILSQGRVEQAGTPQEVYEHPATRFVASFIGRNNLLDAIVQGDHEVICQGQVLRLANDISAQAGCQITIGCRPEHLVVHTTAGNGANRLPGIVRLARSLGPRHEVIVDVDSIALNAEWYNAGGRLPEAGDRVFVEMPARALQVHAPGPAAALPIAPVRDQYGHQAA